MARDRDYSLSSAPVPLTPRSVIASARRLDLRSRKNKRVNISRQGWQQRCWYYFDTIGEYYYAMNWVGNLLSRAKLVVQKDGKTVKTGIAADALKELFGGPLAQAEMLRQVGVHLSVAGEAYIIGEAQGTKPDKWGVFSNLRVSESGGSWNVDGNMLANPLVLQIFRPHPLLPGQATSASRPVLPVLSELEGFGKRVAADIDSRLTGAGLLLLPSEVDFAAQPVQNGVGEDAAEVRGGADGIQDQLIDAASAAIQDQESASAKVPLVATMPGDQIGNVKHITFWSEFDQQMLELRKEAVIRLALGLDMPPEALTGTGDMNHWNAWQLEEAAIKVHTEPLLQLITSALTTHYLWPLLEDDMDEEERRRYTITADTTELRLRPNRSKEAQELYDRGALSIDVMLRENGFDPTTDKMGEIELKEWFLRKVASGSTTPELVADALRGLGIPITVSPEAAPAEARPIPSLDEHPSRDIPNDGVPPELVAAGSVLVYRALERAGNRLKNKGAKPPTPMPAAELYLVMPYKPSEIDDLLQDAWSACDALGVDCPERLDAYTRSLLVSKTPPSREGLAKYLGAS